MKIKEKTFLNIIQIYLEKKGCYVMKEIMPDQLYGTGKKLRVDMIFYKEEIGWWGIECKIFNTLHQGAKFSKSFEQLKKYMTYTYKNVKIKNWGLLILPTAIFDDDKEWVELTKRMYTFINGFLKQYNINFLVFEDEIKRYENYPQLSEKII